MALATQMIPLVVLIGPLYLLLKAHLLNTHLGVFVLMDSWNNLLYPLTLVNSNSRQTLPPGLLQSFGGTFKTDWGGMMAASVITSIPLIVAFLAVQRSMRGLTAGALAGT